MISHSQRRQAFLRLAIIGTIGTLFFSWLLYQSATAQSTMLLRLWHDQDSTGTVSAGDIPAAGVDVAVKEATCTGQVCAASTTAYIVTTNSDGYVRLALDSGEYEIAAPCMVMTVTAADVVAQGVQEAVTCLWGVWLAEVWR